MGVVAILALSDTRYTTQISSEEECIIRAIAREHITPNGRHPVPCNTVEHSKKLKIYLQNRPLESSEK